MNEYTQLKEHFKSTVFKNAEASKHTALEKAYADMSRRASGHSPKMKEHCVKWLENEIFTDNLQIPNYDTWHQKVCKNFVAKFNELKTGFGTVGKAQKVINMAFKYLACITDKYNGILPNCHMTLDGYTLSWYKTYVMPWAKKQGKNDIDKFVEWSKINNYDDYMLIQTNIRDFLKENKTYSIKIGAKTTEPINLPCVPFEAEFVVWEGEIVRQKYDTLTKELDNYIKKHRGKAPGRDKDSWIIGTIFDDYLRSYLDNVKQCSTQSLE